MRILTDNEVRLMVELLDEEDSRSQELICRQILEQGKAALPHLEAAYSAMDARLRPTLNTLVREIRRRELDKDFELFAADQNPDLERGAFLIARVDSPAVDEKKYSQWLDAIAETINPEGAAGSDPETLLRRFNEYFFKTLGFRGNQKNYYDPANSAIDHVIESRQGIPISLSILYLLLGWRLKLPVSGVGLPGHFIVRFDGSQGPVFIDPFYGGKILTRQGCRQLLHSLGYGFREEYLYPVSNREIMTRMLRNLILIYQRAGRPDQVQQLSGLLEILLSQKPAVGSAMVPPDNRNAETR